MSNGANGGEYSGSSRSLIIVPGLGYAGTQEAAKYSLFDTFMQETWEKEAQYQKDIAEADKSRLEVISGLLKGVGQTGTTPYPYVAVQQSPAIGTGGVLILAGLIWFLLRKRR